jgi:adenylate kinase
MMKKDFFNIVLLGAPGSGKGTQADLIKRRYHLHHVSTGDLYRQEIAAGTELGITAKELIDKGELCPDELTLNMLYEYLSQHTRTKGFILDGVPRTIQQAKMMEGEGFDHIIDIKMAIYIKVEKDIVAERLFKRAELIGRSDDSPEVIKQRIINYENLTYPVAKYFRQKGLLHKIDGMRPVEEVFHDICQAIDSHLQNDYKTQ